MRDIILPRDDAPGPLLRLAAFAASLILAPQIATLFLVVGSALLGLIFAEALVVAMISLFSIIAGMKTYLLFGGPVFALLVLVCHGGAVVGALAGVVAMMIARQVLEPGIIVNVGMVYAPIWGATFGFLYRKLVMV